MRPPPPAQALAPSDTRALHAAEEALAQEPMLCFQTLLELFFVARHAYCWHPRVSRRTWCLFVLCRDYGGRANALGWGDELTVKRWR